VRLPVDYFTIEERAKPGVFIEQALAVIDRCIGWCKDLGLNLILDLHEAPGFEFFLPGSGAITLFTDAGQQERFINIWRMLARRYRAEGRSVMFELLNELVWETSEPWNDLSRRTVAAVREIDAERVILIGGNNHANVNELANLALDDDPHIAYTFHFYEPGLFTHQHVEWIPQLAWYQKQVDYPFRMADHAGFFEAFKGQYELPPLYRREVIDAPFLYDSLEPARAFMARTGKEVLCGEFGVCPNCGIEASVRWFEDTCRLFGEMGVGHTVWNYTRFSHIMQETPRKEGCRAIIDVVSHKPAG